MRFHPSGGEPEDDKDGQRSMVHGKNRIPCRIDRRLTCLAELNMMPLSRSGCSLSLKTHNMGNPGSV